MAHYRNDLHYRIAEQTVQRCGVLFIELDGTSFASTLEGL